MSLPAMPPPMPRHRLTVALWWDDAWHELPEGDVIDGTASHVRGLTEDGTARPGEARFRIHDDAQRFDPDNEVSDLFGLIGPRTPVRITTDGVVDFVGEAFGFQPGQTADWDPGPPQRGWRWVDVRAAGVTRRLGAWPKTLESAYRRQLSTMPGVRAYWPLEDPEGTTQLSSALPGGRPIPVAASAVRAGTVAGPDGSGDLAEVDGAPQWGTVLPAITSGVWRFGWAGQTAGVASMSPAAGIVMGRVFTSTGYVLELAYVDAVTFTVYIYHPVSGVSDLQTGFWSPAYAAAPSWWLWWYWQVTPGANTVVQTGAGDDIYGAFTLDKTLTGWNLGYPVRFEGSNWDGYRQGHIVLSDSTGWDMSDYKIRNAFYGWPGERAAVRASRLCAENGQTLVVVGDPALSQPMGAQRPDTLIALLRECAATEDGLLTEDRATGDLWLRTRRSLYAAPVLQLVYPADVAPPFVKVTDDVDLANVVTVKQREGGEATAALTTGPLGTAAIGEERREVRVNVANETQLAELAQYHLSMLSAPGARYPSVTVDAQASPELAAAAQLLQVGDLVTVTGYRPQTIWLQVIAIAPSTSTARRTVTLTTLPGLLYGRVGVWSRTPADRYSVVSAVAVAAAATGAITVEGGYFDTWSTTAVPYDWSVRGERVTVTAITAPVLTGGKYRQTATVDRSVNGAVRAHPVGTPVGLYDPAFYGR